MVKVLNRAERSQIRKLGIDPDKIDPAIYLHLFGPDVTEQLRSYRSGLIRVFIQQFVNKEVEDSNQDRGRARKIRQVLPDLGGDYEGSDGRAFYEAWVASSDRANWVRLDQLTIVQPNQRSTNTQGTDMADELRKLGITPPVEAREARIAIYLYVTDKRVPSQVREARIKEIIALQKKWLGQLAHPLTEPPERAGTVSHIVPEGNGAYKAFVKWSRIKHSPVSLDRLVIIEPKPPESVSKKKKSQAATA